MIEHSYNNPEIPGSVGKMNVKEQNHKRESFLNLQDFNEYMETFELFCGLQTDSAVFRKEMDLMEKDANYTHREKEKLREKKKRETLKKLHSKIETLMQEIETKGIWITPVDEDSEISFRYRYPNGKNGDIAHYLAGLYADPENVSEDAYSVRLSGKDCQLIELLVFPERNLFAKYDYEGSEKDDAVGFLLRRNRIAQIEQLMYQVNYYRQEYRSLRTIPDPDLKALLQTYHGRLHEERDRIYEYLIGEGKTKPKWISEQKAYAIVKEHYPDALFQHQPEFLYGQRLDIFIPSRNTAIEYQGKQHYEPVEFFGGEEGYQRNLIRDERKRRRCKANGIQVLHWDYNQPLTEEFFRSDLMPKIEKGDQICEQMK